MIPYGINVTLKEARANNNSGQIACLGVGQQGDYVAVLLTPIPPRSVPPMPGDTNCDRIINVDDLLTVINHWGDSTEAADFNHDNIVNVDDLLIVITNWS